MNSEGFDLGGLSILVAYDNAVNQRVATSVLAGMDDYVSKPVIAETLAEHLSATHSTLPNRDHKGVGYRV